MTIQKLLDGLQAAVTTHSTLTLVLIYLMLNLIEISPIKVHPLSWIFRGLRKALVGSLEERMSRIEAKNDLEFAKISRARIQRFSDECYNSVKHSKEHFEQVFDDAKSYEMYCKAHPEFENHKTVEAVSNLYPCASSRSFTHASFSSPRPEPVYSFSAAKTRIDTRSRISRRWSSVVLALIHGTTYRVISAAPRTISA